jgi:chemotaxis protein methyltransferase CheR
MTDQEFDYIRKLLKDRCAIALEPGKEYLVEARLLPVARQLNLSSISALVTELRTDSRDAVLAQVVEAMVTTETSFFRDHNPFETLRKKVLPDLIKRRGEERTLSIWCAACSTGQEPYSLAIMVREHFPQLADWKVTILASDLSRDVLARAEQGVYNQTEANRGMPASLLVKYFDQHGTSWQLRPTIRNMVRFQEINLAQAWPFLPRMDLVMLRNVMIYFDVEAKKLILTRVGKLMRLDGYLLLGGSETTINLVDCFKRIPSLKSGFYQLVG